MGVGRGWKITSLNVRNRAIFWIFFGILLVQGKDRFLIDNINIFRFQMHENACFRLVLHLLNFLVSIVHTTDMMTHLNCNVCILSTLTENDMSTFLIT